MAEDGNGRCASRVGQPLHEPLVRVVEVFRKEVPHDGVESRCDLAELLNPGLLRLRLHFADFLAALVALQVTGVEPFMGRHEILVERYCVGHEFDDACG